MSGRWMITPPKKRKTRGADLKAPYYVEGYKDGYSLLYACRNSDEIGQMMEKLVERGYHIAVFSRGRRKVRLDWFCCSTLESHVPACEEG